MNNFHDLWGLISDMMDSDYYRGSKSPVRQEPKGRVVEAVGFPYFRIDSDVGYEAYIKDKMLYIQLFLAGITRNDLQVDISNNNILVLCKRSPLLPKDQKQKTSFYYTHNDYMMNDQNSVIITVNPDFYELSKLDAIMANGALNITVPFKDKIEEKPIKRTVPIKFL